MTTVITQIQTKNPTELFSRFFKQKKLHDPILTDMHSHILPALDDGAKNMDESINLIKGFIDLGYKKLIATPHIMQDYYPNTVQAIREKKNSVEEEIKRRSLPVLIEVAAEYYLDEYLLETIHNGDELLLLSNKYILFEMSFMNESPFVKEFIFKMKSRGITPILAHVERYTYYMDKLNAVEEIIERGALIQMNINSISGLYSRPVKKFAEKLIDAKFIHLLGSDCHNILHLNALKESRKKKYYEKAVHLPLLNNSL